MIKAIKRIFVVVLIVSSFVCIIAALTHTVELFAWENTAFEIVEGILSILLYSLLSLLTAGISLVLLYDSKKD